jgi:hypothetical protein
VREQALKEKYKSAKQRRDWLAQSIQTHLLPVLMKQKFEPAPPPQLRAPADRESILSFPLWGRLVRARESGVDLIEIQLASYRRAAFRVNAGVAPKAGVTTFNGQWPAEEVAVHWLNEYFELYPCPRLERLALKVLGLEPLGAWFSVWHWPYRSPIQEDYEKLARRAARYVSELELALSEGRLGPHLRRVVIPRSYPPPPW